MSFVQNFNLLAAAVGATFGVLSVATVFVYNKWLERQQRAIMKTNIDRVSRKVAELQAELKELRAQQSSHKTKCRRIVKRQINSNENTYSGIDDVEIDTYSTAGTDIGDEEFFDCSDDEISGIDLDNGTIDGTVSEITELLDLDADSENQALCTISYHKLKTLLQQDPTNVEIVWRFAKICYYCSTHAEDSDAKKDFIFEGCEACENILYVRNCNLYKWYAILIGVKGRLLPIKEEIENGYKFKEYVQKALDINPNDSFLHHLMGRFKYEVSELSWVKRKVASTLFSEVPSATYEDAISSFETAEKLAETPHHENRLLLSKSYIAIGKYQDALPLLNQLNEIPANTDDEYRIQNEASKLLEKYSEWCT